MKRITGVLLPLILLSSCALPADAGLNLKVVNAPPLCVYGTNETTDLGVWDAAFACDELDCLVLRQGEQLFSLPMVSAAKPVRRATIRPGTKVEIVTGNQSKTGLWLFCQSPEVAPFALELNSGKRIELGIPGIRIPGEQAPSIQSHVMVPHRSSHTDDSRRRPQHMAARGESSCVLLDRAAVGQTRSVPQWVGSGILLVRLPDSNLNLVRVS